MVRSVQLATWQRHFLSWSIGFVVCVGMLEEHVKAQRPTRHFEYSTTQQPPGAIGRRQLLRGGPMQGYYQPVRVRVPTGAKVSVVAAGCVTQPQPTQLLVGMLIGPVYRLQIAGIPNMDQTRLYPTIEVINRLYPPDELATEFPLEIDIPIEDLRAAANGTFVTRVVYLEDPRRIPSEDRGKDELQPYFDVLPSEDPLITADELGRPMAIVRIGSRIPAGADESCAQAALPYSHSAPVRILDHEPSAQPQPKTAVTPAVSTAQPLQVAGIASEAASLPLPSRMPPLPLKLPVPTLLHFDSAVVPAARTVPESIPREKLKP